MKLHLLSARRINRNTVSTRWIDGVTLYQFPLEGTTDGDVINFKLGDDEELLYVPPYGMSSAEVDLFEAQVTEGKTKRGDRLVTVVGGTITIDDISIRRKLPAIPRVTSRVTKAEAEVVKC